MTYVAIEGLDDSLDVDENGAPVSGTEFLRRLKEWEDANPPLAAADTEVEEHEGS